MRKRLPVNSKRLPPITAKHIKRQPTKNSVSKKLSGTATFAVPLLAMKNIR